MPKILAFAGSARIGSFNKKLVSIAAAGAKKAGADVTVADLADYPMPIFDSDVESEKGMPEMASVFKNLLISHDGFLIASPEYNSAFTPLLKNVIDWSSRKESEGEPSLLAFRGKTAVIMSAAPGRLGGMRGLVFLRMLLNNLGIIVLPNQKMIPQTFTAFNEDGSLAQKEEQAAILNLGIELAQFLNGSLGEIGQDLTGEYKKEG